MEIGKIAEDFITKIWDRTTQVTGNIANDASSIFGAIENNKDEVASGLDKLINY